MDQPGKVANPARGQLNRERFPCPRACLKIWSRETGSAVPSRVSLLISIPGTQAESGAYLRDSSRVPRRRPFMKPPYAIGSVPSLSGHAIAYRWRSLPRVRRHRASKPQGSSERVLPWQITMDQLIFASLSHTNYWYEVGMLKVPAVQYLLKLYLIVKWAKSVQYIPWLQCMYYGHTYSKSMDQPSKVANPARGQLNRDNEYFPVRVCA